LKTLWQLNSYYYAQDGVDFLRELFVSSPSQLIVMRLSASEPGALTFNISLDTIMPDKNITVNNENVSLFAGNSPGFDPEIVPAGLTHESRLRVLPTGGTATPVEASEGGNGTQAHIRIEGADNVVLLISVASSYVSYNDISADPVAFNDAVFAQYDSNPSSYEELKEAHITSHQELFNTFSVELGPVNETAEALPLDTRIQNFQLSEDPGLIALFIQFGRYLLISSGRDGAQPPNLQGIWQDQLQPNWGRYD
jgi:alpha-L-fucosidase 2